MHVTMYDCILVLAGLADFCIAVTKFYPTIWSLGVLRCWSCSGSYNWFFKRLLSREYSHPSVFLF